MSLTTVLCSVVVIVLLIIAIFSGKAGRWIRNKKNSDQPEVNFDLLQERSKLKDYCVFNLCQETTKGFGEYRNYAFLKKANDELTNYLEWTVEGINSDNKTPYYIGFTGKEFSDVVKISEWIEKNPNPDTWIVISKNTILNSWNNEEKEIILKKDESDYQEFSSKNEAVDWLRKNDGYFKS